MDRINTLNLPAPLLAAREHNSVSRTSMLFTDVFCICHKLLDQCFEVWRSSCRVLPLVLAISHCTESVDAENRNMFLELVATYQGNAVLNVLRRTIAVSRSNFGLFSNLSSRFSLRASSARRMASGAAISALLRYLSMVKSQITAQRPNLLRAATLSTHFEILKWPSLALKRFVTNLSTHSPVF